MGETFRQIYFHTSSCCTFACSTLARAWASFFPVRESWSAPSRPWSVRRNCLSGRKSCRMINNDYFRESTGLNAVLEEQIRREMRGRRPGYLPTYMFQISSAHRRGNRRLNQGPHSMTESPQKRPSTASRLKDDGGSERGTRRSTLPMSLERLSLGMRPCEEDTTTAQAAATMRQTTVAAPRKRVPTFSTCPRPLPPTNRASIMPFPAAGSSSIREMSPIHFWKETSEAFVFVYCFSGTWIVLLANQDLGLADSS